MAVRCALPAALLLAACTSPDASLPSVGKSTAELNRLAGTNTKPIGEVAAADIDRISASGQLTISGTGAWFSVHNHLPHEVEDLMVRIVIMSDDGEVVSDRTYASTWRVSPRRDSAHLALTVMRTPRSQETFAWGIVGASKR